MMSGKCVAVKKEAAAVAQNSKLISAALRFFSHFSAVT